MTGPARLLLARMPRRLLTLGVSGLALAGWSPLALLARVAGRDPEGIVLATDLAYGPHPRHRLDVYGPAKGGSGRAPVAVFFHGGSWSSGSRTPYGFAGAALAARGFVAFVPEYRLHPEVRFPAFLEDGAAAIRFARDEARRYGGDGDRIVLVGHSAGGYNAAMLALDRRYLHEAGVPADVVRAFAGLSAPYDFLPLDPGMFREVFGAAPDPALTQPVSFVTPGSPPAYLATGGQDVTVRPRNTAAMAARLREAGVRVEERLFPGLTHGDTLLALTRTFRSRAPILDEMTALLSRSCGEPGHPPLAPSV